MRLPRLLVDENLSIALPAFAHRRGFQCAHVAHIGFRTWKDWHLLREITEQDWVLVTNNAFEFRERYRLLELHPGAVFILPSVQRPRQIDLFQAALGSIERTPDLINTALDVLYQGEQIAVRRYALP